MNISTLEYFKAMANKESIKEISEELHISPQALSAAVLSLERELGYELFNRSKGQKNELNAYGISFLQDVEQILDTYNHALEKLKAIRRKEEGVASVACTGFSFPNKILSDFILKYPQYQLARQMICYDELEYFFEDNSTELIFSSIEREHPGWESKVLWEEKSYAVVFIGNPLAKRDSLRMEELKNEKFVLNMDKYYWHHSICGFCRKAGFEPEVSGETFVDHFMFYIRQNCVAVVSQASMDLRLFDESLCKIIPLEDDFCTRRIRLMKRRRCRLSAAAEALWDFAVNLTSVM